MAAGQRWADLTADDVFEHPHLLFTELCVFVAVAPPSNIIRILNHLGLLLQQLLHLPNPSLISHGLPPLTINLLLQLLQLFFEMRLRILRLLDLLLQEVLQIDNNIDIGHTLPPLIIHRLLQ